MPEDTLIEQEPTVVVGSTPIIESPKKAEPSLKQQTAHGVKWLVGSSFLQKAISLGATVILARILGPSQFGLFALAFIAIDALGLFKSMGFDSALIQRKDNIEKAANTAFFIIPVLGILLYFVLAISAPLIGRFLNNQDVVSVIRVLGIIFVISCLGKVPVALLEKNMHFKGVSIIEISSEIIYAASAIILALLGFAVWSLVIAYIAKTINHNVLSFIFSKWRPRFEFDKKIVTEMFHFGKFLFLGGLIMFLKMNLDNILVGKLLGATKLGFYAIAFNVANFVSAYFGAKIYRVTFPAFSSIQNQTDELKRAILRTSKYLSIIGFPVCIGLIFFGNEIINFFYGNKWIEAATTLKILAIAGLFNTLPAGMGAAINAYGRSKASFYILAFQVLLFFIFIFPAAKIFGLNGVASIVSITGFVTFVIIFWYSKKIFAINFNEIAIIFKPSLISTLVMTIGIMFFQAKPLQFVMVPNRPYSPIVLISFACFLYLFVLLKIEKNLSTEIRGILRNV